MFNRLRILGSCVDFKRVSLLTFYRANRTRGIVPDALNANKRIYFDELGYNTDGIGVVMFFVTRPQARSEVEMLDWYPATKLREKSAAAEN
ncbi:hypothetical protein G8770_16750 [Aestuariicella hydrocarbonica]|uniref:Uncharacterized protein n=1 Tax=Pseudomaricurvus hydrocarbonicus TaxID=1470433 RepID=A0A9E5T1C2_9GAMM|nr:hypothetical protein [Aestuariicella hydrocarbonica]NHO67200.1 hypothetical protein [Aestuariicella hydrocarbonica]